MSKLTRALCITYLVVAFFGCGEEASVHGSVDLTIYGEAFIEDGIPAEEMGDGWAVAFTRFVVSIDEVTVGGVRADGIAPIDISGRTSGAGHAVATLSVPAGTHSGSGYVISRVEVSGRAVKDGVTKTFDWSFDQKTTYTECEAATKVSAGGRGSFEITVHGDHFFFDSIVSEDPEVLFQSLADADRNGNGVIARSELEAEGLGAYDPGSSGNIDNLWAFLVAQASNLGHVNGEGHCMPAPAGG